MVHALSLGILPVHFFVNVKNQLRVLVVDDHEPFRKQVCGHLQQEGLEVICEASNGLEAVQHAEERQPDLVILDVTMPTLGGIEAAVRIRRVAPKALIVFLSQHDSTALSNAALATGAQGYVLKSEAFKDLVPAINAVVRGEKFVSKLGR